MTNGEKIKEIFSNMDIEVYWGVIKAHGWKFDISATRDWWNAEYKPTTQERQAESDRFDAAFQDGYNNGYAQARFDYEQEPTTNNDLAQERYQDLIDYFGDKEVAKTILEDRKEFKAWLERLRWNVKRADELARELERIKGTTKNDLPHCQYSDEEIAKSFIEDVEAVKDQLPCGEQMDFPSTFDEFAKDYGFKDKDEVYTNGSELIPVFRVKQWLEHISTIKNDLVHNLCDSCKNIGCVFQSGIVRTECAFYMPPQLEPDNCGNYVVQDSITKNDLAFIHTEGLDEEIRCTMCTNSMKSDKGCDGSCVVNKDMYKAVMDAIEKRIQPTTKNNLAVDCIDRQATLDAIIKRLGIKNETYLLEAERAIYQQILAMPSVTPQLSSGLEKNSKKLEKDFGELDCISRQAVLEQAYAYGNGLEPDGYCVNVEDIQALPSVTPQTRWIPVSERLPNNHEYIKNNGLFNVSDGNRSYFDWFDIYNTKRFVKPTIAGFCVDNAVTAWMPLPEPYKEVEK